jgi:hypothetical protein
MLAQRQGARATPGPRHGLRRRIRAGGARGRSDFAAHAAAGMLNIYTLRREGRQWKVLARHENVASMGSFGNFGSLKWVSLGPGKPGFIVSSGGVWQGNMISGAGVFELGKEVRQVGGYSEASSNAGACVPGMEEC